MVGLTVNGVHTYCPDRWALTSTDIFQKIIPTGELDKDPRDRDPVKLFAILTGTSYEGLRDSEDYNLEAAVYALTKFVYEESRDFASLPIPLSLRVGGKTLEIPRDVGKLTIGQNAHVRRAAAGVKDAAAVMSLIVAIYLQPLFDAGARDGKMVKAPFDFDRALELEKDILLLPIVNIYPIGFFFLSRLKKFGAGPWHNSLRTIQRKIQDVHLSLRSPRLHAWMDFLRPHL